MMAINPYVEAKAKGKSVEAIKSEHGHDGEDDDEEEGAEGEEDDAPKRPEDRCPEFLELFYN